MTAGYKRTPQNLECRETIRGRVRFLTNTSSFRDIHDVEAGRKAAHRATLNVLAVARQRLGPFDKVARNVRLGVSVATSRDGRDLPKMADTASELLEDVFGEDKSPCLLVYGVASFPLGTPVALKVMFEVAG